MYSCALAGLYVSIANGAAKSYLCLTAMVRLGAQFLLRFTTKVHNSSIPGRPKVMMQCFERLLKTLVACPRRDEWDDSSLQASAHYLFQILGALASSVPHDTSNYKLSNLISGSDMSCILHDRQDLGTCAEALEFCFYLVPDREFIKMLLGPGFQATGRDSLLSQLCKLLSRRLTAQKTQVHFGRIRWFDLSVILTGHASAADAQNARRPPVVRHHHSTFRQRSGTCPTTGHQQFNRIYAR
ncbi:hypothetical protein BDZ88DRAFT_297657 [Geranomyces variabilis]|nr:hypothetical protein BDZ88DRAFT_297657 [Geranomyces variabilis]